MRSWGAGAAGTTDEMNGGAGWVEMTGEMIGGAGARGRTGGRKREGPGLGSGAEMMIRIV